jgi:hypothetical protein
MLVEVHYFDAQSKFRVTEMEIPDDTKPRILKTVIAVKLGDFNQLVKIIRKDKENVPI